MHRGAGRIFLAINHSHDAKDTVYVSSVIPPEFNGPLDTRREIWPKFLQYFSLSCLKVIALKFG